MAAIIISAAKSADQRNMISLFLKINRKMGSAIPTSGTTVYIRNNEAQTNNSTEIEIFLKLMSLFTPETNSTTIAEIVSIKEVLVNERLSKR